MHCDNPLCLTKSHTSNLTLLDTFFVQVAKIHSSDFIEAPHKKMVFRSSTHTLSQKILPLYDMTLPFPLLSSMPRIKKRQVAERSLPIQLLVNLVEPPKNKNSISLLCSIIRTQISPKTNAPFDVF